MRSGGPLSIEKVLQDDCSRSRVQLLLTTPPVALLDRKAAFGLAARQTFILEDDRHRDAGFQRFNEHADAQGLGR